VESERILQKLWNVKSCKYVNVHLF
jgi:hypothetical protein